MYPYTGPPTYATVDFTVDTIAPRDLTLLSPSSVANAIAAWRRYIGAKNSTLSVEDSIRTAYDLFVRYYRNLPASAQDYVMKQIAQAYSSYTQMEQDLNCVGNGGSIIGFRTVTRATDCEADCMANGSCNSWTFDESTGNCYLNTSANISKCTTTPGFRTQVKVREMEAVPQVTTPAYLPYNPPYMTTEPIPPAPTTQLVMPSPQYQVPVQNVNPTVPPQMQGTPVSSVVSGRQSSIMSDTRLRNLVPIVATNIDECRNTAASDSTATGWTFDPSTGSCSIATSDSLDAEYAPGVTSGRLYAWN